MRTHVVGYRAARMQIDDFSQFTKGIELNTGVIFQHQRLAVPLVEHPCGNRDPQITIVDLHDDRFATGTQRTNNSDLVIKERMKFVEHT